MARDTGPLCDLEFSVPSMVCDGCADRIRQALTALPGVQTVKARLWRKCVQVRFDPSKVQDAQLQDAFDAAGYNATRIAQKF
ncbi:MAG: heavy-metal-associated domain-containing protein [Alphaproteobacteria bacterium]